MESDELGQLMPNLQHLAVQQTSPAGTTALRNYIKVLGESQMNIRAASVPPHKPRTDGLQPRGATGRRPQRRYFTIKWSVEEPSMEEQPEEAELDPEALKDALLEQAKVQRWALMEAAMRPGTGRLPRRREFAITLPPLQLEQEDQAAEDADQLLAEQAESEEELVGHITAHGDGQEWAAEEGVLAEQQRHAELRPADAQDPPASTAATPGAGLANQSSSQQEQPDSRWGRAKTPATSLHGRYTPMEGVPERLVLLATRAKQPPATASRSLHAARTPAGFTPLEGIPERLMALQGGARAFGMPGATLMCSNEVQQSVDSPVEGLVQHGERRSRAGAAPLQPAGTDGFAGFAQLSPPAQQQREGEPALSEQQVQQQTVGSWAHQELAGAREEQRFACVAEQQDREEEYGGNDDDNGGYGFDEDGGYGDADVGDGAEGGLPLFAGQPTAECADACVQTGASLAAAEAEVGGYDVLGADGHEAGPDGDLPETSAAAQQRAQRRPAKNPGSRLRNELKRKSLAVAGVGRHEVVPGVRRSSRSRQEPLKWWLNEKKEFGRQHKTMPTVENVVHKMPNTPWQTVTDFKRPAKKRRQRAATPHDLADTLAATAAAGEDDGGVEQEEEEEEEEVPVEQQQQQEAAEGSEQQDAADVGAADNQGERQRRQGRGQRRTQAAPQRASQRQARAAAAKAPAARGKATKRKAAGSKRRSRR